VSSLVTVALAMSAALFLAAPLDDLPQATLGAMVFVAVLGLIRPSEFVFLARFDRLELFVALLVLRELNHPDVDELRVAPDGTFLPAADGLAPTSGLLVLRIGAPLYTANLREVQRQILGRVAAADPAPQVVVVDATVVGPSR
jgi:sulfate permease, SulP family